MKAKLFLILAMILATSFNLKASEISVVDVKRNITLSDEDVVYKDFYLNIGENGGLKKNLVVNVKRKIDVKDSSTKSIGNFETVVGQLKIIHLGEKVAVAREYKLLPRDQAPMLEQIGIMTGDAVDLNGSFVDNSKPAAAQTAEVAPPVLNPSPVVTVPEPPPVVQTTDAKAAQPVAPVEPNKVENTEADREPATQLLPVQKPMTIPEI